MDGPGLFDLAQQRLEWIDQRQRVLAGNVANADTPGFRPRDLPSFSAELGTLPLTPVATQPLHLAAFSLSPQPLSAAPREAAAGAVAPDGNAVDLESEMTKIADDETDQAMVSSLWHSTMGMYLTALGKD